MRGWLSSVVIFDQSPSLPPPTMFPLIAARHAIPRDVQYVTAARTIEKD